MARKSLPEEKTVDELLRDLHKLGRVRDEEQKLLEKYNKAIREDPKNIENYIKKINLLFKRHRYKRALEVVDTALLLDPKNFEVWNVRGIIMRCEGKPPKEIIAAFDNALKYMPKNKREYVEGWVLINKIIALNRLGDYKSSLKECNKLLKWNKESSYSLRAEILKRLGKYEEALEACDSSLEVSYKKVPKKYRNKDYYFLVQVGNVQALKGDILSKMGEDKKAIKFLKKAFENINRACILSSRN